VSRIVTSGFETPFSPTEEGWETWDGTAGTEASSWESGGRRLWDGGDSASVRREVGGAYYLKVRNDNAALSRAFKRNIGPAVSEAWGRFAFNDEGFVRRPNARIFEWHLNGIGLIAEIQERDIAASTFGVKLVGPSNQLIKDNGTQFIRGSEGVWSLAEWHIKLAGSDGRFELWWDGVKRIDYTGPLAGPGGETVFDAVIVGQGASQGTTPASPRGYDDIAINDVSGTVNNGRIGDGVILNLRPVTPGTTTQLLSDLGAAAPHNFSRVSRDEDPNGFVGTDVPGSKDTYRMGGLLEETSLPTTHGSFPSLLLAAKAVQNGPAVSNIRYSITPGGGAEIQEPAAPGLPLSTTALAPTPHIVDGNSNSGDAFAHDEVVGIELGFSLEA